MPVTTVSTASRTDLRTRPDQGLAFGARGEAVSKVQEQLGRAGFATEVDGVFGKDTLQKLKAFQEARGLTVTVSPDAPTVRTDGALRGVPTGRTWIPEESSGRRAAPVSSTRGPRGRDVSELYSGSGPRRPRGSAPLGARVGRSYSADMS